MLLRSPYFRRLFVPYLTLSLAGALIVGLWGAAEIRATYMARTRAALLGHAHILELALHEALSGLDPTDLQARTAALGANLGQRVTVIATDGQVLGDSAHSPEVMNNHRDRAEFRAALESGQGSSVRHSSTLHQDMLYVARRIGPPERPLGVIRVATGLRHLDRAIRSLYLRLATGACLAFAAIAVVCYTIARSLTRPMIHLTAAANTLAAGDFDHRIAMDEPGELGMLAETLNHMAGSIGRLVRRIAQDQSELRTVLSSMVEGVIAVDKRLTVRVANESAARIFEFELSSAKGRPLDHIVRHPEVRKMVREVSRTGQLVHARVGPTPTVLELDVLICPVKESQAFGGLVVVAQDAAESERYQQLRTEFVGNVSHELRTPLALIQGFVETLQDGAKHDPVNRDRFLERIQRNAQQLSNLVNDLLELSELEERGARAEHRLLDLATLTTRVCEALRPAAEAKQQRLTLLCSTELPSVYGQPRGLERAVANLVDNAIKYTEESGRITVQAEGRNGDVAVVVEDTGLGIPPQDLPRIFERFFRADKSRSREMGGTGLGLSIVKHVVQSHGGSIEVDSNPGRGSRFTIVLPAATTDVSTAPPQPPPGRGSAAAARSLDAGACGPPPPEADAEIPG